MLSCTRATSLCLRSSLSKNTGADCQLRQESRLPVRAGAAGPLRRPAEARPDGRPHAPGEGEGGGEGQGPGGTGEEGGEGEAVRAVVAVVRVVKIPLDE